MMVSKKMVVFKKIKVEATFEMLDFNVQDSKGGLRSKVLFLLFYKSLISDRHSFLMM